MAVKKNEPAPIRDEFKVHMLNDTGKSKATAIAVMFSGMLNEFEEIVGWRAAEGPDMAIARQKLQEASFYVKRAMAMREENQELADRLAALQG